MRETRCHTHEEVLPATPQEVFTLLHTPSAIRRWWAAARAVVLAAAAALALTGTLVAGQLVENTSHTTPDGMRVLQHGEPYDAYGMEWEFAPGRQSLVGRL